VQQENCAGAESGSVATQLHMELAAARLQVETNVEAHEKQLSQLSAELECARDAT